MTMRWAALTLVLGGCLHPSSLTCPGPDGTSWVCPADLACAQPPTYCGTAQEVGACDGKAERDPCSTSLVPNGLCISSVCEACSNDIAGCRYVGWLPMTSPTTVVLHSIAFTQFGEAYAGGDNGTMFHYLNARWEADSRFPTTSVSGVSIGSISVAGDKVYALAGPRQVFVLDGNAWTAMPALTSPPTTTYKAVWAAPSGEVFLVGPSGSFARWDGTVWSEPSTQLGVTLYALWGKSATDLYAAGAAQSLEHYNGVGWTSIANPGSGVYNAVFGAGGEVFAAGKTSIVHGDGTTFSATPSPLAFEVRGLWGSAADDVFAVGDNGIVIHWDGVAWTQMQASTSTLYAVAGSSAAEVFAVGDGGTISRYTGAAWATETSTGATMPLLDIAAMGPDEAVAVGSQGIFHFHNGGWTPELPTQSFTAVAARGPSDAVAVGTSVSQSWNGSAWSNAGSGSYGTPGDVWPWQGTYALVSDDVWTHGTGSWTNLTNSGGLPSTRGLWVAPSGRFWLAGAGIEHVDGSSITTDISAETFSNIWGAGEADVFATGAGIQHYDGTAWTAMTVPTTNALAGIWGRAGDDVFAVGSSSTVLHYHAGLWQPFTTPFSGDLTSVSGAGSSIYMTAKDGKVHRLIDTAP